jgi:hypothetical protein
LAGKAGFCVITVQHRLALFRRPLASKVAPPVLLPKGAAFLPELETELLAFPYGKTDDAVDSATQGVISFQPSYTLDDWVD